MKGLELGSMLPQFNLKNHEGVEITNSDLRGKKVWLSFHPLAWTAVCEAQMKNIEGHYDYFFKELNVYPLGISIDHMFTKQAWARAIGIEKLDLLSDFWPTGELAKACNLFREDYGSSERADLLFDEEGKLIFQKVYPISEVPELNLIVEAVKGDVSEMRAHRALEPIQ